MSHVTNAVYTTVASPQHWQVTASLTVMQSFQVTASYVYADNHTPVIIPIACNTLTLKLTFKTASLTIHKASTWGDEINDWALCILIVCDSRSINRRAIHHQCQWQVHIV